jgi:hypothetical protein
MWDGILLQVNPVIAAASVVVLSDPLVRGCRVHPGAA